MKKALIAILLLAGVIAIGFRLAITLMPDVYIVPFEDVSVDAAAAWGEYIARDLDIRVKVLESAAYPPASFNFQRRQFITEAFADAIVQIRHNMLIMKSKVAFIGLLSRDMYPTTHDWRYCYALNFIEGERNRISIISSKRLASTATDAQQVVNVRVYKLLKRAIGFQLYGLNATTNKGSVLYGPLLSVEDLDNMGFEY